MKGLFWLVVFGLVLTAAGMVWYVVRKFKERQLAEEARMASFLAATAGSAGNAGNAGKPRLVEAFPAPTPEAVAPAGNDLAQQKLLFEAAHKAGEAGEPVLAIQLYARLLARFPASAFVPQARAAAGALKKKLVKT